MSWRLFFFSDARADVTTLISANRLFEEGKLPEAAEHYRNVIGQEPKSRNATVAAFNLGNALFHGNRFTEASVYFREVALKSGISDEFKAEARFNAGNAFALNALNTGDMNRKKKLFETALYEYRKALLLNPDDMDIKINAEIILRHVNALNSPSGNGHRNVRNHDTSFIGNDIVSNILEQAAREEREVLREKYRTSSQTMQTGSNKDW